MEFVLTDEQQMLADSLSHWTGSVYGFDQRRAYAAQDSVCETNWSQLAQLGVLGLIVPEEHGGLGGTPVETFIAMQAFGKVLLVEPVLQTAILCASLLKAAARADQQAHYLPRIVAGQQRLALAALEPAARYDLARVTTRALRQGSAYQLDGHKAVVLNGDSADTLIVSARTSGASDSRDGITLFLVDTTTPGVTVRGFPSIDGMRVAEVSLQNVRVEATTSVGAIDEGYAILEGAVDLGTAALCAEAVGAMEAVMGLTVEYLRSRKQFGRVIGTFQALQHRAADMAIAIEQARSITLLAAARANAEASQRRKAISAAKAIVGRSARLVGEAAIQLHGGMGMTDEFAVGHYFKRLTCIDMTWGNSAYHVGRYGAEL